MADNSPGNAAILAAKQARCPKFQADADLLIVGLMKDDKADETTVDSPLEARPSWL